MNRSQNTKNSRNGLNLWKWAFISLVAFLVGLFVLFIKSIQPVRTNHVADPTLVNQEEVVILSTAVNKEDAEWLMNTYLNETIGEDFSAYDIRLTDQLELHGSIEFFSLEIPFALYFALYVLENGDLQLRGESVQLANISLPVSTVLSLFANQVEIPEFMDIDSQQQIILVHLSELTNEYTFDVSISKIDLVDDIIEVNLYLDEQSIYENLQSSNNGDF